MNPKHLAAYCAAAALLASCAQPAETAPQEAAALSGAAVSEPSKEPVDKASRRATASYLEAIGSAEGKLAVSNAPAAADAACGAVRASDAGFWNRCAFSPRPQGQRLVAAVSVRPVPESSTQFSSRGCRSAAECPDGDGSFIDAGTLASFLSGASPENAAALYASAAKSRPDRFVALSVFASGASTFALVADGAGQPVRGSVGEIRPAFLVSFAVRDGVLLLKRSDLDPAVSAEWSQASAAATGLPEILWFLARSKLAAGETPAAVADWCRNGGGKFEPADCDRVADMRTAPEPSAVAEAVRAKISVPGTAFSAWLAAAAESADKPW